MKKVVFMLQNGIGFGHFKLALTISKYLKNDCEISFITQAKSTRIFDDYNYKVYNFPMLYTLKSNNEILIINNILNDLIEEIKPDLVIEDTYPEDFYLNLPSLVNIPKLLLLNRLDSSEFENYYFNGTLNQYERVIVLKNKDCFINEITSKEVRIYAKTSERLTYLEGVYNEPTDIIKSKIRKKYNLDNFSKNIVVNCGAGGWHIGSNICETIFEKVIEITNKLVNNGMNIQTILVLGPYSDYLKDKFKNKISTNIKIVDFETNLDALFQLVDLCILRPGYNSTMEALSGRENIILLPGISYMENQNDWCSELKKIYGIDFVDVKCLDELEGKILKMLRKNYRTTIKPVNNTEKVAAEIKSIISQKDMPCTIHLAINNLANDYEVETKKIPEEVSFLTKNDNKIYMNNALVLNMVKFSPELIQNNDFLIINNDVNIELNRLNYYESRYNISHSGSVIIEYNEIKYKTFDQFKNELLCIIRNSQRYSNNIIITFGKIAKNKFYNEISKITAFLNTFNIKIESLSKMENECVQSKVKSYQYGYYRPEITKLT